jgi:ankyrin repeat protein
LEFLTALDGIKFNFKDSDGDTALIGSVIGRHPICTALLSCYEGVDINATNKKGHSAFFIACYLGEQECARILLRKNIDVNIKDKELGTPLLAAASSGSTEIVKALLTKENVDVNWMNKKKHSALFLSSYKGHFECVQVLLKVPNINYNTVDQDGDSCLIVSAMEGYAEILKLFLETDCNINAVNKKGFTALFLSCLKGQDECVRLLLDTKRMNINYKNRSGSILILLYSNIITINTNRRYCFNWCLDIWKT